MLRISVLYLLAALVLSPSAPSADLPAGGTPGRPVRIVSFSFPDDGSKQLAEIAPLVDREGAAGTDLIILPEVFLGLQHPETLDGPAVRKMQELARKHHTYIICPIDRLENELRYNTAVLIDRQGGVAGLYDKTYDLFPIEEFGITDRRLRLGERARVFETDFGRMGIAICFDVNFPELWQRFDDAGAELVIWPSAYSSGRSLQAHAINHHYYIISATGYSRHCQVYDLTGERLLNERAQDINITRVTLDLDRGIYHNNLNLDRLEKLLAARGADVEVEQRLADEEWFVLKARRPGVSARALAREFGLTELRDYIHRARAANNRKRGGPVATETVSPPRPSGPAKPVADTQATTSTTDAR